MVDCNKFSNAGNKAAWFYALVEESGLVLMINRINEVDMGPRIACLRKPGHCVSTNDGLPIKINCDVFIQASPEQIKVAPLPGIETGENPVLRLFCHH